MLAAAQPRDRYSHRAHFRERQSKQRAFGDYQAAGSGAEGIPDTIQHRAVGHIPGVPQVGDPP
jgi:hypothetical protein